MHGLSVVYQPVGGASGRINEGGQVELSTSTPVSLSVELCGLQILTVYHHLTRFNRRVKLLRMAFLLSTVVFISVILSLLQQGKILLTFIRK